MKLKTHLKVRGEPVYIVINDDVLETCYFNQWDAYTCPTKKVKIIYLPTKRHIQKFLIKHELYHLRNHSNITQYASQYYPLNMGKGNRTMEIRKEEIDTMLANNEIYKKGNIYYIKKYFIDKKIQLFNYVKEEYLKLEEKENDLH